jgi:predicted PurR-regulated permease PerM
VLLALGGALAGAAVLVAPAVSSQVAALGQQIPSATQRLERWWNRQVRRGPVAGLPEAEQIAEGVKGQSAEQAGKLARSMLPIAASTVTLASSLILMLALAFFFAYEPDTYRSSLRALVPRAWEPAFDETWCRVAKSLRGWLHGIVASMTIMGVLTAIGLKIAGVTGWFTLGLITLLGTFVPYAGAVASAIPGLAVGLSQSTARFLYALIVYLCVHLIEGYIVEPLIMRRVVRLNPASLLLFMLLMSTVFGIAGTIAATPILVCLKAAIDYLYVERTLGKSSDGASPLFAK